MPKKNMYTQKDFEKDLKDLEKLMSGGKTEIPGYPGYSVKNTNNNNMSGSEKYSPNKNGNPYKLSKDNINDMGMNESFLGKEVYYNAKAEANANKAKANANKAQEISQEISQESEEGYQQEQQGGKAEYTGTYRRFKISKIDGKEVNLEGRAEIKEHHTPLNAAKKLLTSYAKHHELRDNGKIKLRLVYTIVETTRGSKNKEYGPYFGKYYKYNAEEAAKAKASGISFKFKPMVKLYKAKENMQKGGKRS